MTQKQTVGKSGGIEMEYETHEEAMNELNEAIEDFVKSELQIRRISEAIYNLTFWESETPLKMRKVQMWLGMSLMAMREHLKSQS